MMTHYSNTNNPIDFPMPVAWMTINAYGEEDDIHYENPEGKLLEGWTYKPLYTTPPAREWVGLTDEDFQPMLIRAMRYYGYDPKHSTLTSGAGFYELVRAIEAKLKEKNT